LNDGYRALQHDAALAAEAPASISRTNRPT
jgi:hypothetical protein